MNASVPLPTTTDDINADCARIVAVTSGKGGVGKSNIALNLALGLAQQGLRTCLFDADANLANINILLGLAPRHSLDQLLAGNQPIEQLLAEGPGGLKIVPAASGVAEFVHLEHHQQRRLLAALSELERTFDYLLIDTAAGIDETLLQLLMAAPAVLMVITPEPTSLTDAFSLLKLLKRCYFNSPVYAVVNMAPGLTEAHATFKRFRQASLKYLQLDVHYLGYVLNDPRLPAAVKRQRALLDCYPESAASRCLTAITGRLQQVLKPRQLGRFSSHFAKLLSDESTPTPPTPRLLSTPAPPEETAEERGLATAMHYAQLLARHEAGLE